MQIPSVTKSGNEPFVFKNGTLTMPTPGQFIPPEQQDPNAGFYNLAIENDREEFSGLLKKGFDKKILIWHLDYNWNKDGDCLVVVFYSTILPKSTKSSDADAVSVGVITPQVFNPEVNAKEERLFDEFVKLMNDSKENELLEENGRELKIEDDEDE
jgi:hypothetical protein